MKLLNTDCSVPEISSLLDELVFVKTEYTATFLSVILPRIPDLFIRGKA